MKFFNFVRPAIFCLGGLGLIVALFLVGLNIGLSVAQDIYVAEIAPKFGSVFPNEFSFLAGAYGMISIFLILFLTCFTISKRNFVKLLCLVPLVLLLLQFRIPILLENRFPGWVDTYAEWVEMIYYAETFLLLLTLTLIILHALNIWIAYKSPEIIDASK
jgi:hypothetical protein